MTSEPLLPENSTSTGSPQRLGFGTLLAGIVLTAMGGGMAWGIRGQYGHESGAMMAGALAGFTLILLYVPRAGALTAARAVAMMTVAIGFGGTMTYGQTLGLTHGHELLDNEEAFRWGLLGLFIKGGIWISFGAVFLGMGLGARKYRAFELAVLIPVLFALMLLGFRVLNAPFNPREKVLPKIYFSATWDYYPEPENPPPDHKPLRPRREYWGGLLFALAGLVAYTGAIRRDFLAVSMAVVGFIAGGLGFAGAECLQAYQARHPEVFTESGFADYFRYFNWHNMMETAFGAIFGAVLAIGLWCNQKFIAADRADESSEIAPRWEFLLFGFHIALLSAAEFGLMRGFAIYTAFGLVMGLIPLIGITGGRYWPYLLPLPALSLPIAGKTLREMCYNPNNKNNDLANLLEPQLGADAAAEWANTIGWIGLVIVPLSVMFLAALWLEKQGRQGRTSRWVASVGLLLTAWLFFSLNWVFFNLPWPWLPLKEWTGRTPNGIIFTVCLLCLSAAAIWGLVRSGRERRI